MLGRLHDHYGPGKASYDAVSARESPCQGRLAQVVFGDQGSVASDRLEEASIASWVYDREAAGYLMKVYLLTAWTVGSTNFAVTEFSEVQLRA
jgi:hypothetical protein